MSRGEKKGEKKMKIKTQNDKIVETDRYYGTKHSKKQLLDSRRNSAM